MARNVTTGTPVAAESIRAQLIAILAAWGMPQDMAETTAGIMVETDLMGVDSHGLSMMMTYEDGVRANLAARASVQWDDGRRANVMVGRSFRAEQNPVFTDRTGLRTKASDWIVAADAQPLRGLSLFTRARLDSDTLDIHRLEAGVNASNKYGNGFVRYLTDNFDINGIKRENLDVGGEIYIFRNYGVSVYGNRDLKRDAWVIRDYGVFYRDDCLRLDVIYRREDTIIGRLLPSESVSVRLTLATLGGAFNGR